MKLDQSCLVLEKRRCWGCGVWLCITVVIVMVLNACSTSISTRENGAFKQPDVPRSQEQLENPARQVGVSVQTEIGEKAAKRPVAEKDSESPAPKQKSIENSEAALGAGQQEGAAQTDDEKLSDIENKMDESLTEFDEMLLEKNREISIKKQRMSQDAGEDSTAIGSEDDDMGGQEREGGQDEKRISGGEEKSQQNENAKSPSGPEKGRGTATGQPKGIPDGSDDDVVARQLREAAEKETDPQLKKKLWEEYRRYKAG